MRLNQSLLCKIALTTGLGDEFEQVKNLILRQKNCFRAHNQLNATPPGREQPEPILYAPIAALSGLDLAAKYNAMFQYCLAKVNLSLGHNQIESLLIIVLMPNSVEARTGYINPKLMMSVANNEFQDAHINFVFIENDLCNQISLQCQQLIDNELHALIVIAIDSIIEEDLLTLINQQQVQSVAYHQGMIPGEAAIALLFMPSSPANKQHINIYQRGFALDQCLTAECLTHHIKALITDSDINMNAINYCLTDFANTNQDAKLLFLLERELWHGKVNCCPQQISIVKSLGNIGVVKALLQIALAWQLICELIEGTILIITRHSTTELVLLNKK